MRRELRGKGPALLREFITDDGSLVAEKKNKRLERKYAVIAEKEGWD